MKYRIDRIDFVGDAPQCSFQDGGQVHHVRKGVAFILKDNDDREYVAGPVCAKRHTKDTNWGERVPDFTTGIIKITVENHSGGNGARGEPDSDDNADPHGNVDFAISYLRLRMEKLANQGFSGARYQPFEPYYEYWKAHGILENSARSHIENTERKIRRENGKFHMERLQRCYATAFLIDAAQHHQLSEKSQTYVDSVRRQLVRNHTLSDKQIEALKDIFSRLPDPLFKRFELSTFS